VISMTCGGPSLPALPEDEPPLDELGLLSPPPQAATIRAPTATKPTTKAFKRKTRPPDTG